MPKYSELPELSKKQVVILKLCCMPKPITASIVAVEEEGIWFINGDLSGNWMGISDEIKNAFSHLNPPVCFVPRERIDYILTSENS